MKPISRFVIPCLLVFCSLAHAEAPDAEELTRMLNAFLAALRSMTWMPMTVSGPKT